MDEWGFIVTEYSRRLMTNEDDKLVAILAIHIVADLGQTADSEWEIWFGNG